MRRLPSVAHVGLAVADLDRAVAWFVDAFGFEPIGGPTVVTPGLGHAGAVAADVFGPACGRFRLAHLGSANGTALELFEFGDVRRSGLFHVCLVAPDIERVADRVAATGGRRISRIWPLFRGEPYRMCYCQDPFGNLVELYTHSHERTYANREAA